MMNFNPSGLEMFGFGFIIFTIFVGSLIAAACYYLAKRKTETPVLAAVIGFFTAFILPLALIYLIVLVLMRDLPTDKRVD
jgi:1,4-dihydroxy-2-naphthoate octaprenyltransferase